MASFHSKTFKKHDDYMTPISAWNSINHFLPAGKVVWEPFFGDGTSGKNLMKLGHRVIHQKKDFFKENPGQAELIVTNPPYSIVKDIMPRLLVLDLPFVLLMPSSKLNTQYIREWKEKGLQIIIPRKRIQFIKCSVNKFGCVEPHEVQENKCNFDCFYYCYKMNLPQDIIWLDDDGKGDLNVKTVKKIKLLPREEEEEDEEEDVEYWNKSDYFVTCDICGRDWDKKHDHRLVGVSCHSWAYQTRAFCCPSCIDDGKCKCDDCDSDDCDSEDEEEE